MFDFLIVGGGIVGTFIARELSQYDVSTLLLEKEADLAQVQTTHNSALVHSPVSIPREKGTLKSRFALEGNRMHREIAVKFGVPVLQNGAYMLAFDEAEMDTLKELQAEANDRGLNPEILDSKTVLKEEPSLNPNVLGALEMADAMTADTYDYTSKLARNARLNGVRIELNAAVEAIDAKADHFVVTSSKGTFKSRHIINAAGVKNAHIAAMVEDKVPYKMEPHRGEYYVLGPAYKALVGHTLFPVPKKETKGILVIPQPDGTIRLGPTSTYQSDVDNASTTDEGLKEVKDGVNLLVKNVPFDKSERTYAGLRSTIDREDFYIQRSLENPRFIHVAGIDSPGVTAAPAIARYLVEEIIKPDTDLKANETFDPYRL
ncbi:MAG: NAD(P)/FAD-dependent oxidoreductase [Bacillota bacterium]